MADERQGGAEEAIDGGQWPPVGQAGAGSDVEAFQEVSKHLRPNETLVWAGRPDPASRFTAADVWLVPFSVLWFGFAIFWCVAASIQGGAFGLFGVPFVILGAYMAIGRFVYKARRHRVTRYGLTERRAIVVLPRETHDVAVRDTAVSIKRS